MRPQVDQHAAGNIGGLCISGVIIESAIGDAQFDADADGSQNID